jgi:hypothetical protein
MSNSLIIADAHVHFHECFNSGRLLDMALKNFRLEAGRPFTGLLFLTDIKANGWFLTCRKELEIQNREIKLGTWTIQRTGEDFSLAARLNGRESLMIIAGRQIKTAEGLEVLALGTLDSLEEGKPVEILLRKISQSGALPVIPWGVGKWFGRRGDLVRRLIDQDEIRPLFLGDNGNRPVFWPRPKIFDRAEEKEIYILPGSDPLPFPSEIEKIGRIGFKIDGSINPDHPGRDIKKILHNPDIKLQSYGSRETPFRFFWNQLKMNLSAGGRAFKLGTFIIGH